MFCYASSSTKLNKGKRINRKLITLWILQNGNSSINSWVGFENEVIEGHIGKFKLCINQFDRDVEIHGCGDVSSE